MDSEKLQRLERKWLLVDTSVWINIAKYGSPILEPLLGIQEKYSCTLAVHRLIVQEYLSFIVQQELFDQRSDFIDDYPAIAITKEIEEIATHISRLYALNNLRSASYPDRISAAFLRKYEGRLFMLTNDIKDFPISVFNPFEIWPFDGGRNELFAFYEYDPSRYENQERMLTQASQ